MAVTVTTVRIRGCSGVVRPQNAFLVFSHMHRQELKERLPHLSSQEITKQLGDLWAKMTPEHKNLYYEEAEQKRFELEQEKEGHGDLHAYCIHRNQRVSVKSIPKEDLEQEIKFGGYVPPFHIFSAKMKHLKKLKMQNAKRQTLPEFHSFMHERDRTAPQFVPSEYDRQDLRHPEPQINRDPARIECDGAVASIMTSSGDNQGQMIPHEIPFTPEGICFDYSKKPRDPYNPPSYYPSSRHHPYQPCLYGDNQYAYMEQANCRQTDWASLTSIPGQAQFLTEDHNAGHGEDEETNYVLVPCDINVARMLGWPVQMLQKVPKSMLTRFKAHACGGNPVTVGPDPSRDIQTALVSSTDSGMQPTEDVQQPQCPQDEQVYIHQGQTSQAEPAGDTGSYHYSILDRTVTSDFTVTMSDTLQSQQEPEIRRREYDPGQLVPTASLVRQALDVLVKTGSETATNKHFIPDSVMEHTNKQPTGFPHDIQRHTTSVACTAQQSERQSQQATLEGQSESSTSLSVPDECPAVIVEQVESSAVEMPAESSGDVE